MEYIGIEKHNSGATKIKKFKKEKNFYNWILDDYKDIEKNLYTKDFNINRSKRHYKEFRRDFNSSDTLAREIILSLRRIKKMVVNYTGGNILSILGTQQEIEVLVDIFLLIKKHMDSDLSVFLNINKKTIFNKFIKQLQEKQKEIKNEK